SFADASGGWHTGGGYTKSVRSTCLAAADMLYAMKLFGESFSDKEKELISEECRWGLEWLLKMQDKDGSVYNGISVCGTDMASPEEDNGAYFFSDKSCSAALLFTAAAALGANYFAETDTAFSKKLRHAAELSWIAALGTEEYENYCSRLGSASESGDGLNAIESEFMWAMCEMYALTGESSFEKMIMEKYILSSFYGFGYSTCGGFAALSYLMNSRSRDRSAEAFIRKRLTDRADRMTIAVNSSGYRTARSAGGGYKYGSNFAVLSDCMDFITAYLISGEQEYLSGAIDQFGYIFGKNPMGISYVTGVGSECCRLPCHIMSSTMENDLPLPGMVVSGANVERSDEYSKWHIEKGTPEAKCYADNNHSLSTNEPAVHFSAPLIFISAFFDKVGRSALTRR
ncbi:MAG: glycoside hydrolase family 9 protein, partial [Huintestinicola sp.]